MNLLCAVLRHPERLRHLTEAEWDALVPLARYAKLLGTLDALCAAQEVAPPAQVAGLLRSETTRVRYIGIRMNEELKRLAAALADLGHPVVLLKGAAYLAADLPPASGRRFNDIDLLVPRSAIEKTEQQLLSRGWRADDSLTAYDQHYYRAWMHEIPPLRCSHTGIEIDLHHNLTPPVSRMKVPGEELFDAAVPLPGTPFWRLSDTDLFLHSAVHLLFNDELRGGLRDLWDLALLARHFGAQNPRWWTELEERSGELNLRSALYLAVLLLERLLGCKADPGLLERARAANRSLPRRVTLACAIRVLAPASRKALRPGAAMNYLYLRSHLIRMPPLLLATHLLRKTIQNFRGPRSSP